MSLHAGQQAIVASAKRFNVEACGRRFGKTTQGIALAAYGSPGSPGGLFEGYPVGWFAPYFKDMSEAWNLARRFLGDNVLRTDGQQWRIFMRNGATFDFWSMDDPDAGRSRKYALVILDEAAKARHLQVAWEQAIRPTLTDYKGGAWFLSTPKGLNYFYQLRQKCDSFDDWAFHHAPTSANPFIDPAEIEDARRSLPERVFRQEYMAEFIADGAGVFRSVYAASGGPWLDDAQPGRSYTIGVDWGRSDDFTVFCVVDDHHQLVHVDRFTGIGYELQVGRLFELWRRFKCCPVIAESNSMGGPLIENLQRRQMTVRGFHTTNASKAEAIEALALAIENGKMALTSDKRADFVRDELLAFESERLPSGLIRYGAPPGFHDDGVMALAIAWHGASIPVIAPMMKVAGL